MQLNLTKIIEFDDAVVVSGCGPLSLDMIAAAKLKCPKLLIAMDLYDWKVCHIFFCLIRSVSSKFFMGACACREIRATHCDSQKFYLYFCKIYYSPDVELHVILNP